MTSQLCDRPILPSLRTLIRADTNSPDDSPQIQRDGEFRTLAHAQIDFRPRSVEFPRTERSPS